MDPILLIHHLSRAAGLLYLLAAVSSAAMNMVYKYLKTSLLIILRIYPDVEMLDPMIILCLIFWGTSRVFSTVHQKNITLFFFFWLHPGHKEVPGQGSNLSHNCSNAGSLIHYTRLGTKPTWLQRQHWILILLHHMGTQRIFFSSFILPPHLRHRKPICLMFSNDFCKEYSPCVWSLKYVSLVFW